MEMRRLLGKLYFSKISSITFTEIPPTPNSTTSITTHNKRLAYPHLTTFTGETYLLIEPPIDPPCLTRWRQRPSTEDMKSCLLSPVPQTNVREIYAEAV